MCKRKRIKLQYVRMPIYFRQLDNAEPAVSEKPKQKYRKYDEWHLDFAFICSTVGNEERRQCVICFKVLAADSMLPNKLRRHLEIVHNLQSKDQEFLSRKSAEIKRQKSAFSQQLSVPSKPLLASYKVAHRVVRSKKPQSYPNQLKNWFCQHQLIWYWLWLVNVSLNSWKVCLCLIARSVVE